MRVLLAIDTFGLVGGSERYAEAIAGALAERGHAVGVLCAASDGASRARAEVLVVPETAAARLDRDARARIAAAVAGFRPDVLYALAARSNDLFALFLELAPVVRHVQDHTLFCPGLNKLFEDGSACQQALGAVCLERYFLRGGCSGFKIDARGPRPFEALHRLAARKKDLGRHARAAALVVASRHMQAELAAAGLPRERTVRIPYFTRSNTPAVPRGALPEATRAFLAAGDEPLVVTPARLALPDKGVDVLITALGRLEVPWRAVIAGAGPAEGWLRQKAQEELGPRAHFTGWLDAGALETLYAAARVVAFPSVWDEPFGLVGLEAMAHAKPVVAFEVGGVPDWLVHGENGLAAPRRDVAAFAAHLELLLRDAALAQRLGDTGRELLAARFSPAAHLAVLEPLLERAALTQRPRAAR